MQLSAFLTVGSCSLLPGKVSEEAPAARRVNVDRAGLPIATLSRDELDRFKQGDALFEATIRESDGLGPLYVRDACSACHAGDGRGPGLVTKVVPIDPSKAIPTTLLPFGPTERPYTSAGAKIPLLAPRDAALRVESRLPPAVFGRGYLEAIADTEIERLARLATQRQGSARGRLNRLKDGRIGRFGIKARLATLRDFAAEALNGDMGVTSPLRPEEPAGPEGLRDDDKPGVDFTIEQVELLGDYVRALQIPERRASDRGRALFESAQCGHCHVPSIRTSIDYPIEALSNVNAEVYTDLLLHDMGSSLADGVTEDGAGPREFRTAPLIGLRFLPRLLHDGRAQTVEAAILAHGEPDSEASDSVNRFRALEPSDRGALLEFVELL
ncbi:MAG TPA: di-heme oxidoredictase family protein [Polyangiaceae bacterium]|nr:di-heme oxidoredictase family protein [Polyangiaceae bacterium]